MTQLRSSDGLVRAVFGSRPKAYWAIRFDFLTDPVPTAPATSPPNGNATAPDRLRDRRPEFRLELRGEQWDVYRGKLWDLLGLLSEPGAPSYAPDVSAVRNADDFLWQLKAAGMPPSQILPSVVGGLGISLRAKNRKVYVEFTNRGNANALFSDGVSKPAVEKIVKTPTAYFHLIEKARAYLQNG